MNLRLSSVFSYLGVGLASLLMAVVLATWIFRPATSQDSVALPPPPPPVQVPDGAAAPGVSAPATTGASPAVSSAAVIRDNLSFLEPYVFDMREGRRNPFQVPLTVDATALDMTVPGSPLERYELDQLKLVGILWDVRAPRAMFVDPVGEVHVLSKDDRIGRRRGYVAVIREGEVVVVEATTFNGENAYATRVLRIDR